MAQPASFLGPAGGGYGSPPATPPGLARRRGRRRMEGKEGKGGKGAGVAGSGTVSAGTGSSPNSFQSSAMAAAKRNGTKKLAR